MVFWPCFSHKIASTDQCIISLSEHLRGAYRSFWWRTQNEPISRYWRLFCPRDYSDKPRSTDVCSGLTKYTFLERNITIINWKYHYFSHWYIHHFPDFNYADDIWFEHFFDWRNFQVQHRCLRRQNWGTYVAFRGRHQKRWDAPRKWSLNEIMHWYWDAILWGNQG